MNGKPKKSGKLKDLINKKKKKLKRKKAETRA